MTSELARFLDALEKLPPFEGMSYRGLATGTVEPASLAVVTGVVPTSLDPRQASENFTVARLLVLLNRTGRDVSALSEDPREAEVVVRPGSAWRRLIEVEVAGLGTPLLVLEELDAARTLPPPTEWPRTLAELDEKVRQDVSSSMAAPEQPVRSSGRFSGAWPARAAGRP